MKETVLGISLLLLIILIIVYIIFNTHQDDTQQDDTQHQDDTRLGLPVPSEAMAETNERISIRGGRYANAGLGEYTINNNRYNYYNKGVIDELPHRLNDISRNRRYYDNNRRDKLYYGSVNTFAPKPELISDWEKIGIVTLTPLDTVNTNNNIMNLYRRPIAPAQDLWEYSVQDHNGFIIKLENTRYLENDDIINNIIGKIGSWKVQMFNQNKWILF